MHLNPPIVAWDNHLRQVMGLDLYAEDVLEGKEKEKWSQIKGYIHDKRIF
jgi:hypothetical protein